MTTISTILTVFVAVEKISTTYFIGICGAHYKQQQQKRSRYYKTVLMINYRLLKRQNSVETPWALVTPEREAIPCTVTVAGFICLNTATVFLKFQIIYNVLTTNT